MVVEDMHEFARPEWFMAHLRQFVIDSHQPSVLARFWAAVLVDFEIRAYDQDEVAPAVGDNIHRSRTDSGYLPIRQDRTRSVGVTTRCRGVFGNETMTCPE